MSADLLNRLSTCPDLGLVPGSLEQIGPRSWKALASGGPIVIRVVPPGDSGQGRLLATYRSRSPAQVGMLQHLRSAACSEDDTLAVFDWIDGATAREVGPHLLPRFFESLANWHRDNVCELPVYSPYTAEDYSDLSAFLDGETSHHLRVLGRPDLEGRCRHLLRPLAAGYVTLVHGDVHPGNILYAADGSFRLLDPESVHVSCNFLDLDYIDWLALEPDPTPWCVIREYANDSVAAYFDAIGMPEAHIRPVMTAVVLLTALRSHTNGMKLAPDTLERSRLRIEGILRME